MRLAGWLAVSINLALFPSITSALPLVQVAKLTPPDDPPSGLFGYSLAISGSTLAVGAYGAGSGTGAVYVFIQTATGWQLEQTITAFDGQPGADFGYSVALSGDVL